MNCLKEYEIKFKKALDNKILDKIQFMYSGVASCYQCGFSIPFDGSSQTKERIFKCPKCKLEFSHNIEQANRYRAIASIKEIEVSSNLEKSKEGGNKMETKKDKVKETKVEAKVEPKSTPKATTSEVKESPKAEEKVEKVEAKKEETPVKATIEELPADMQHEAEFGEPVLDYPEVEKPTKASEELKVVADKALAKVEILKTSVRKTVKQLIEARKQVKLYKTNAKEINKRRTELGETKLTDEELLNDDKFALAKAEKENVLLKASANKGDEIVASGVERDDEWFAGKRKEIDKHAELA